jgi:hypothetical protein
MIFNILSTKQRPIFLPPSNGRILHGTTLSTNITIVISTISRNHNATIHIKAENGITIITQKLTTLTSRKQDPTQA